MIKAIVLDLGGVYFEAGTRKALVKIHNLIRAPPEKIDPFFRGKFKEGYGDLFRKGKLTAEEFWGKLAREFNLTPEAVKRIREIWYSSYIPHQGMKELVQKLGKSYQLIIFSANIKERADYLERKHHFLHLFDDFVFSFDYGYSKHDEEFYQILLGKLKEEEIRPEETLLVDDHEQILKMAQELNFKVLLFHEIGQFKKDLVRLGLLS